MNEIIAVYLCQFPGCNIAHTLWDVSIWDERYMVSLLFLKICMLIYSYLKIEGLIKNHIIHETNLYKELNLHWKIVLLESSVPDVLKFMLNQKFIPMLSQSIGYSK